MKKIILVTFLTILLSLPILASAPPVDPSTLPVITWEEVGAVYEVIYVDEAGNYSIISVNGKLMVVYN